MKRFLLTGLIIFCARLVCAQINLEDSTLQVVGYWDRNEKQTYVITLEKYKVKGNDTTGREKINYEVDITIKDSTANSYTIEWFYRNFQIESESAIAKKMASIAQDMPVVIKSNEFGTVQEVINWEEVRDYIKKSVGVITKDLKGKPELEKIINKVMELYSSKQAIESLAIKDIVQFYTYHGGKYTLGEEVKGSLKWPNNFGGKPFDVETKVILEEIDTAENNGVLRMSQTVNSQQLTDETYKYLKSFAPSTSKKFPKRKDFPALKNDQWTATRIHASSGWVLYSVETKEVSADDVLTVEERVIELK